MRWNMFALVAALVATAAPVLHAHGPQIQLTAEAGKIITGQVMIDDYVPVSPETSLYVLPVVNGSSQWLVQAPGTAGSGPGIAVGFGFFDAASHPFKTGNYTTSIVDGLKKWNGASFVDAGATQLQLYKTVSGNPLTATTTDVGPFASLAYSLSVADEEAHTGMGYRFLGRWRFEREPARRRRVLAQFAGLGAGAGRLRSVLLPASQGSGPDGSGSGGRGVRSAARNRDRRHSGDDADSGTG